MTATGRHIAKKWLIANWKMHGDLSFVRQWMAEFHPPPPPPPEGVQSHCAVVVCPPSPYLSAVRAEMPAGLLLGGQDVSVFAEDGAHTGEASARMLADVGCCLALVGHSERRGGGETDADCAAKIAAAVAGGLRPVLCIGEDAQTRRAGGAGDVVAAQLDAACAAAASAAHAAAGTGGREMWENLIIAYEPIWAIGAGQSPSAEDVAEMQTILRGKLIEKTAAFGDTIPFLYGGSVTPAVAKALNGIVDGFLVGGASLRPRLFSDICAVCALTE